MIVNDTRSSRTSPFPGATPARNPAHGAASRRPKPWTLAFGYWSCSRPPGWTCSSALAQGHRPMSPRTRLIVCAAGSAVNDCFRRDKALTTTKSVAARARGASNGRLVASHGTLVTSSADSQAIRECSPATGSLAVRAASYTRRTRGVSPGIGRSSPSRWPTLMATPSSSRHSRTRACCLGLTGLDLAAPGTPTDQREQPARRRSPASTRSTPSWSARMAAPTTTDMPERLVDGGRQFGDLRLGERDASGGDVLLEVADRLGAGDRQDHRRAGQQPGQRDLGGRRAGGLDHVVDRAVGRRQVAVGDREPRDEGDAAASRSSRGRPRTAGS